MASPGGGGGGVVIVLDADDEEEAPPPPGPALAPAPAPANRKAAPAPSRDPDGLRAENQRLFQEFVDFCSQHTKEHPEVMTYLTGRHQKTCHQFLASVEFRNVLGRCLTRVQAKRSKVYVYINELCTVLKANSQKRKLVLSTTAATSAEAPAAPPGPAESDAEPSKPRGVSKRQIRYLENLLRVYAVEIRRLQEQELGLDELDREDSAYLQESRLKRRMMRIFERLCELKDCNSLTGRVIEQRIPYCGTRYPEVNRRIERLINCPDTFPDYRDILTVVQKASSRHNLGLPKRQMESMAADAFREVGNRLKERRHLDLIYNFGSHLTDQYQPGSDPALRDSELSRRLRHNREQALQRLEEVMFYYAQLQDKGEEEEWRRKRGQPPSSSVGQQQGEQASPQASEAASKEGSLGIRAMRKDDLQTDEEEDEEEESSSESDMEVELGNSLEDIEEEEEGPAVDEESPVQEVEADQSMDPGAPEVVLYSSSDEELEEEEEEDDDDEEGGEGRKEQQPPSAPEQVFLLEVEETLPLEASETPPPSPPAQPWAEESNFLLSLPVQKTQTPVKRSRSLEKGSACEADQTPIQELNGQPPHKKGRQELRVSNSTCIEVPSGGSSEDEGDDPCSPPPLHSPAPMADSTCVDSPGLCVVTSSQESPAMVCKTSVATQCDPEEIIILSDSE